MRISRTGFESMCALVWCRRCQPHQSIPNSTVATTTMLEPTDKTFQQHFYAQFQASRTSLADRLEASKNTTSHNDWQQLALDIRKLRKGLTDATSFLTAYDQRQCQAQMDVLEQTLEEIRSASLPKTKFTFKRKTNKPPVSAAPTQLPSSDELGKRDDLPGTSDFHKLSSHSHCRLSIRSISTFGTGPPLSDLTISDLDHCIVDLRATAETVSRQSQLSLTALHIHDLKETVLILPNVEGSVLLHNLYRCTVIVACHQFRMHSSMHVRVYLSAMSNPVIESCSAIAFAEYPSLAFPPNSSINGAVPPNGKHAEVQDFSHIRSTPSPNWFLLAPGSENWDDLSISDDPSPQELEAMLATYLPEAMSSDTV
ncbi:tubulin binding cofactor C-domain-containing protein [Russula ochroleuca]|uniref:Tubulin binding cofactor C-domain-containing protein n=1 Tax=Russula ochroleuca TaxID=152965 RepID=A0A9P5MVQ8_9AGAM|nr:tubulin binding cofactor C-domain-containing protein [Russula ochroleuca]